MLPKTNLRMPSVTRLELSEAQTTLFVHVAARGDSAKLELVGRGASWDVKEARAFFEAFDKLRRLGLVRASTTEVKPGKRVQVWRLTGIGRIVFQFNYGREAVPHDKFTKKEIWDEK